MLRPLLIRILAITTVVIAAVPLVAYMVLIFPNRTSLKLNRFQMEYGDRYDEVLHADREFGKSPELSKAKARFRAWQDETRAQCMKIAAANQHGREGATALLMVMDWWPDSPRSGGSSRGAARIDENASNG